MTGISLTGDEAILIFARNFTDTRLERKEALIEKLKQFKLLLQKNEGKPILALPFNYVGGIIKSPFLVCKENTPVRPSELEILTSNTIFARYAHTDRFSPYGSYPLSIPENEISRVESTLDGKTYDDCFFIGDEAIKAHLGDVAYFAFVNAVRKTQ